MVMLNTCRERCRGEFRRFLAILSKSKSRENRDTHGNPAVILSLTLCPPWLMILLVVISAARLSKGQTVAENSRDWPVYLGENGAHYSPLAQINKDNVKQLQIAWTYDTEETGGLQTSPIVVHRVLYGISPTQKIFALDAATGKVKWRFDSGIVGTQPDRGLAYWED